MRTTLEHEVSLTGVMMEARASWKNFLEMGKAGDWRSDRQMDVVMQMATVVTTNFEFLERNSYVQRRWKSEALPTDVAP